MNKTEFLTELRQRLKRLPTSEAENAINYYEEYFNDAGIHNEQSVINELGKPKAIAAKIIGEFAVNDAKVSKSKQSNTLLIVILAILASPIAFPIAIAVIAIVFAAFMVIASLGFSALITVVAGVAAIFAGFSALFTSFATGIYFIGSGLLTISISYFIIIGVKKLFALLQKSLGKFLIRRSVKNEQFN